jgi:hypothetical protein
MAHWAGGLTYPTIDIVVCSCGSVGTKPLTPHVDGDTMTAGKIRISDSDCTWARYGKTARAGGGHPTGED